MSKQSDVPTKPALNRDKNMLANDAITPRRQFLKNTFLSGVSTVLLPAFDTQSPSAPPKVRRFELDEATIADLQKALASGTLTARSLTHKYLSRIEEIDKNGPALNSMIEINPDALAIADALDKERKEKGARGPLHGIPVLIKDNIDTADGMQTTAGSLALLGSKPAKDSFVAQKLREAGAVILGQNKSQRVGEHSLEPLHQRLERTRRTDQESLRARPQSLWLEFRIGRGGCRQSLRGRGRHGDRRIGGMSGIGERNCWHQTHARLGQPRRNYSHRAQSGHGRAPWRAPSAMPLFCWAHWPASILATAPPRRVRAKSQTDYTKFLDPEGLRGARIGVARKYFGATDATDELMNNLLEQMKQHGAMIVDPADLDSHGKFDDTEFTVLHV